jgi:hypothetical protein
MITSATSTPDAREETLTPEMFFQMVEEELQAYVTRLKQPSSPTPFLYLGGILLISVLFPLLVASLAVGRSSALVFFIFALFALTVMGTIRFIARLVMDRREALLEVSLTRAVFECLKAVPESAADQALWQATVVCVLLLHVPKVWVSVHTRLCTEHYDAASPVVKT